MYRDHPGQPLGLYKHGRLIMGAVGSSSQSIEGLLHASQVFDKIYPIGNEIEFGKEQLPASLKRLQQQGHLRHELNGKRW